MRIEQISTRQFTTHTRALTSIMRFLALSYLLQSRQTPVYKEMVRHGGGARVLSTARKIAVLAELHNLPICPHGFHIGPALFANIHWALCHVNMEWLEIPFFT